MVHNQSSEPKMSSKSAAEIDELFNNLNDKDVQDDDFDVDVALEDEPISKQGDIWLLGKHKLICGDSTKGEIYEKLMDVKKANLCVTDPPYNVSHYNNY